MPEEHKKPVYSTLNAHRKLLYIREHSDSLFSLLLTLIIHMIQ